MKSRHNQTQGVFHTFGTYNNAPYDDISLNDSYLDRFDVNTDETNGDFKTPNDQFWYKVIQQRYQGNHYVRIPALNLDLTQRGVQGSEVFAIPGMNVHDLSTYDVALSKIYDKLRGSLDLSVDLFQQRQTNALLKKIANVILYVKKHPFSVLRASYLYFTKEKKLLGRGSRLRGTRRNQKLVTVIQDGLPKKIIKDAGSLWLEYIYGLKPLVQDVFDTVHTLNTNIPPLMKVTGHASSQESRVVVRPWLTDFYFQQIEAYTSTQTHIVCQFKASANAENLLSNFTSLNPASVAWELLPFSFVADWFYDVGGYMRALESAYINQNRFVTGYWVSTLKCSFDGFVEYHASDILGNIEDYQMSGATQITAKFRFKLIAAPFPKAPVFNTDLSSGRLLNAAALLTNLLRK